MVPEVTTPECERDPTRIFGAKKKRDSTIFRPRTLGADEKQELKDVKKVGEEHTGQRKGRIPGRLGMQTYLLHFTEQTFSQQMGK